MKGGWGTSKAPVGVGGLLRGTFAAFTSSPYNPTHSCPRVNLGQVLTERLKLVNTRWLESEVRRWSRSACESFPFLKQRVAPLTVLRAYSCSGSAAHQAGMQDPDPRPAGRVRSSGKGEKEAQSPFLTSLFSDTFWASLVAQMVKKMPAVQESQVQSLGGEDPLEKGMATHLSILAWRIPWTEEPGGLQSMGSQRVGHN